MPKRAKKTVLTSECREFVVRLREYFERESQNGGPLLPITQVCRRVSDALGIGINTVSQISKEKYGESSALPDSDNEDVAEKKLCTRFDEMSIKKHLEYNSKFDLIEGFQDHACQGRSPLIAGYALVFMLGGIRKRVKQPIAYYFSSSNVTADRLTALIKEVLSHCFKAGLNIAATVCDMDGVNRRALSNLGASAEHPSISVDGHEIVTLYDAPHLLKCFRNLFMKYDIECSTNIHSSDKTGIVVKLQKRWKGIRNAYVKDRNKKSKSGSGASTSKEYLYSPLLSFLNNSTQIRPLKTPPPTISDDKNTINIDDDNTTNLTKRKKKSNEAEDKMITKLMQRMDETMNRDRRSGESEPEYNFALSPVEDLKSIHPDYKMDAKMEIMGVLTHQVSSKLSRIFYKSRATPQ